MKYWTELFTLKFVNVDTFAAFFSITKKLLHNLTVGKYAAVISNVLLKAFMAKAIEVPEVQSESRKVLIDGSTTYIDISKNIYANYHTQETCK